MPPRDTPSSALYLLERSDVGVVHLDRDLNVSSMNSYAQCVLSAAEKQPFDRAGGRRGAAGATLRARACASDCGRKRCSNSSARR